MPNLDQTEIHASWGDAANAGIVLYRPGAAFGPRMQLAYQLVIVHTGSVHVTVDGRGREIPAGHVGLLLPGKTESFTFARDRPTRHSWIALAPQMIDGATRHALDSALCCLPLSAELATCVDLACQVDVVDTPGERPVLTALARAALALYLAQAQHQHRAHVSKHAAVVGQAREIARRRATQGIGVDDLAREVGVSPEHLVRLFRRHAGITPGALLREERLAHALHLLTHTGLTVADVARQSGFASPHHFARVVRAATGMTATQLRARSWSIEPAEAPGFPSEIMT